MGFVKVEDQWKKENPFAWALINGGAGYVAGCVSVILTQPQDCVKSRMQGEAAKQLYSGTVDCAMKMFRNEGPAAFFAGGIPRMLQVGMANGISFTLFPIISRYLDMVM